MKVGFISYDTNHLKTEQVLTQWASFSASKSIREAKLFLVPFAQRPPRDVLLAHRPAQNQGAASKDVADSLGIEVVHCECASLIPEGMDVYVVLGVGLLPDSFVCRNKVVNAHPGIIPRARGLDSFKWAIFNGERVGVTLHKLSDEVDMGDLWVTLETPLFREDTLESFARRHYELEIALLSRFQEYVEKHSTPADKARALPSTMRMGTEKERKLWSAFEQYKEKFLE